MMNKKVLYDFYCHIESFDDFHYLLAVLKMVTAPTVSNLKVGTMVNLRNGIRPHRNTWIKKKDEITRALGIHYVEFRCHEDNVLVLFYHRKRLIEKLKEEKVKNFLKELGYGNCSSPEDYFEILKFRFGKGCPDEVGIFLGYPLKDVLAFKKNDSSECKCVGYWKCYNNAESSLRAFQRYDYVKQLEMKKIVG